MERKKIEAAGASKALRGVVNRLSAIREAPATHTGSPRHDSDEAIESVKHRFEMMTEFAIENAKARGRPFRNPFVDKSERLYPSNDIRKRRGQAQRKRNQTYAQR